MADVSIGPPDGKRLREADRGQLLVVAGLVMAVSLVALVVLLNATIYSENVATRGVEATDGEAIEVRATAVEGVGELVDATNHGGPDSFGAANDTVTDGIADFDDRMARRYAKRGGVVHLSIGDPPPTEGRYLATTGNDTSLANATNATAYTFAGGVDRTRGFALELDPDALAETTAENAPAESFHVVLNGSDLPESREVYVYRNATADEVTVATGTNGSDPTVQCSVDAGTGGAVTLDLTGDRLGGGPCFGVWPSALNTPSDAYTMEFEHANAADGEATATVRPGSGGGFVADHGDDRPAVYAVTVDLRYRTADLLFETTVRVAPGEPRA